MVRLLTPLSVLLAGTTVALAWAEIVVRMFALAPAIEPIELNKSWGDFSTFEYKNIHYLPKPGSAGINQAGFKDREFKLEKDPNTFRILMLGDSIIYGLCYSSNHIPVGRRVSEKLEVLLNNAAPERFGGRRFEVYNLGVTGFDAEQEVDLLELKGLQYKPDLVIQVYCMNDDEVMSAEIDELSDKTGEWEEFRKWQYASFGKYLLWSHLYRFLYQRLGLLTETATQDQKTIAGSQDGASVERAYKNLKTFADQLGFPVLVVAQPYIVDFIKYTEAWEHERTKTQALAQGFEFLDLLPAYRERFGSDVSQVSCGEILHPNETGHQLMAEEMFNFLVSSKIFSSAG